MRLGGLAARGFQSENGRKALSSKSCRARTGMVMGRSPDGRSPPWRGKSVDEDQSPDCLGCCDELSRQKVVFPKDKDQDGDSRAESPVGLYTDRAQWCPTCWKY